MKIRTDFVTNSSSSSFVCIRIQSEKLKELFEKYNFNAFSNDDEYNIVIREEDEIGTNDVDSIEGILSVLIEDLEMYCEDDLIEEINNNYDDIINNIEYADYEYSAEGWDEFEDSDEDECFFVYQSAEHLMKSLHKEDDKNKKSANKNIPDVRKNQTSSEYYSGPYEKVCSGMKRDKNKDKITSVYVANTVETLDYHAFKNCCNLKKVYLPSTLKEINSHAFEGCTELEEIIIPEGVVRIYGHSFEGCTKLKTVVLPSTLANIDAYTFKDCTELEEIIIPEGVEHIYGHAFEGCTKLKTIVLPDTLKEIHNNCFCNCAELEEIIIPESVEHIGKDAFLKTKYKITFSNDVFGPYAYAGDISTKNKTDAEGFFAKQNALNKYKGEVKKEIIVPDYIYSINASAFSRCDITEKIILPETLKMLNKKAFAKCNSLKTIFIPKNVSRIHPSAFDQCENLETIIVDEKNPYFYDENGSLYSKENNELIVSPAKDFRENIYTFEGDYSLTNVTIPDGVISIGNGAFKNCRSLTSVTIPNSVISIGDKAFEYCYSLKNVTIPNSVTSIGESAFINCSSLTSITIPDSVTSIESHAFSFCESLTTVTIPDSVTSIGSSAFYSCKSLTNITIPEGVTSIESHAFSFCESLTTVTIPDSVTSIGSSAFYNCKSLTNITIPDSVTDIGWHAFNGCESLADSNGFVVIRDILFGYFGKEKQIEIPYGVKTIDESAFCNCDFITSITLPDSVTNIGDNAFSGCSSLTSITLPHGIVSIPSSAFCECKKLKKFIIPDSVKYIEHKALGFTYNERTDEDVPYKGIKIHGYNNSAAHIYAYDSGFDFVSLGESQNPITDELYNYDHLNKASSKIDFEERDEDECCFVYQSAERLKKSLHKDDDKGKESTKDEKGTCNCDNSKESTKILLNKPLKENLLNSIATSDYHTVGLKFDGTVISTKIDEPDYEFDGPDYDSGQTDVSDWSDIISVAAGDHHTVGLKADGTVVSTTVKTSDYPYVKYDGQCDVQDWKDIISISSESRYTIGLKSDGTVVAVGENIWGQCNVQKWKDIVAIQAADCFTVGLKSDGSVIVTKVTDKALSQPEVKDWKNIISISASNGNILALKPDGTVLCEAPYRSRLFTEVQDWKDIIAISAGGAHAVGLKLDGTVVATGDNEYGQCDVQDWKDIVAIFAGGLHTIGLKKDGTVVSTELEPAYNHGQCEVQNLKDIATDLSVFATKFDESNSCKSIDFSNYKSEQCDTKNGERVVVNNDFSIVVPDGFRCSFNKSKNKLSCDCGGTPYLFYIYKGKCNKDPDDIYDDVLYQYDFVFAFENRLEDDRIAPDNGNTRLSVDGNELEVFGIPIRDEYTAKYCVRYEDESSIIYGFSIRFYGVLYSGSVRFGNMSNESDCRKQFESILRSIQPLTKNQNQNNVVVEKKTSNKNQINYKDCDFEEVDVMASRKKMLTSLDNRRNEDKPKGCDIRLVSLKEIFKDNEDLAIAADIAFNFTMGEDDKQRRKELLQKAQEFAKVFRVSPEKFDPEYDRESEIRNGYIKHIYGWAALKSLVYTGNRYAIKNKTTLFDLSIKELVALSDFIESRGGANFKIKGNGRDTWMTAIRNQFEKNCFFGNWKIARFLHHFDKRFWDDKQVPLQNIIENLYDLIPVMEKIKNYVAEDKSRLNSAIAEILIAWCTFSIACKELFYITKGVDKYSLQQVGDDFIEMPKTADLVNHEENGVVTYKNYAVAYVGESKNVIIPEGIEYFIADRFEDVNELTLPSSLKAVNSDNGFNQFCRYIKKIIFSEGTESLNEYVFLDFSFLREPEEIVLPKSLKVIDSSSLSNTLYKVRYDSYALEYCKKNGLKYEIVYTPEELKEKENNELYSNALREYNQSTIASLNKAIELFDKLKGFKDSFEMSRKAQDKIDLIKKREEERRLEQEKRLEEERRLAEARRLEEERILAERKAAKQSLVTERNSLSVVIEQNKHALFGEKAKLKKEAKARILEIDIELAKYSDLD